jgi:hypothetical protein
MFRIVNGKRIPVTPTLARKIDLEEAERKKAISQSSESKFPGLKNFLKSRDSNQKSGTRISNRSSSSVKTAFSQFISFSDLSDQTMEQLKETLYRVGLRTDMSQSTQTHMMKLPQVQLGLVNYFRKARVTQSDLNQILDFLIPRETFKPGQGISQTVTIELYNMVQRNRLLLRTQDANQITPNTRGQQAQPGWRDRQARQSGRNTPSSRPSSRQSRTRSPTAGPSHTRGVDTDRPEAPHQTGTHQEGRHAQTSEGSSQRTPEMHADEGQTDTRTSTPFEDLEVPFDSSTFEDDEYYHKNFEAAISDNDFVPFTHNRNRHDNIHWTREQIDTANSRLKQRFDNDHSSLNPNRGFSYTPVTPQTVRDANLTGIALQSDHQLELMRSAFATELHEVLEGTGRASNLLRSERIRRVTFYTFRGDYVQALLSLSRQDRIQRFAPEHISQV